jgi:hypothetical protein
VASGFPNPFGGRASQRIVGGRAWVPIFPGRTSPLVPSARALIPSLRPRMGWTAARLEGEGQMRRGRRGTLLSGDTNRTCWVPSRGGLSLTSWGITITMPACSVGFMFQGAILKAPGRLSNWRARAPSRPEETSKHASWLLGLGPDIACRRGASTRLGGVDSKGLRILAFSKQAQDLAPAVCRRA